MPVLVPIIDSTDAIGKLEYMAAYLSDLSEDLVALAEKAKEQTLARFETEIDPDGNRWAPLAPSTVLLKDFRGDPGVLRETDAMMNSLHIEPPEPYMVEMGYGDEIPYAAIHEFGGSPRQQGRRKTKQFSIPARATLGVSEEDLAELHALLVARLQAAFNLGA